jgi:hypothetical protein
MVWVEGTVAPIHLQVVVAKRFSPPAVDPDLSSRQGAASLACLQAFQRLPLVVAGAAGEFYSTTFNRIQRVDQAAAEVAREEES